MTVPSVLKRTADALTVGTRPADRWAFALAVLIALSYAGFFSAMAVLRYLSHHADAFDLGIEDQAMWTTLHGQLFGITLERRLTTSYLGYHVEPISLIGPLLYLLYPSPVSLVVFKNVLIGLGAIPAYWLARRHLNSRAAGLACAVVYALFPGLEAASLYDFHAYALTAPFLLACFCFLEVRRYGWFLAFLALSAATKENSSLDAVPLGLYLIAVHRQVRLGAVTALAGLAWFGIASYLIVPQFNSEGQAWLWTRYAGMGGSPLGALGYLLSHPDQLLAPVPSDPNWQYLARLLAPVAWLTLLSPTALFFMGPALAVNLLTAYGPMHLIETYHYSAHLVPFVILGAIYAMGTLRGLGKRLRLAPRLTTSALAALMLTTTLVYQHFRGYTPLSGEFVGYTVTTHDRLGNQLAQQVSRELPASAAISAQANQYPHLSHRANIWMFPEVDTASAIVLDLSTLPNTTGIDEGIHDQVKQVLASGAFGWETAVDGYLVLRRGLPMRPLPDEFFSFARSPSPSISHPLDVLFGGDLELLGFDLISGRDGTVNLRAYWRARQPISDDLFLPFYITDGQGHEVGATLHREPANIWYPTNRWQPGETVQITSYNLPIGRHGLDFGVALGAQTNQDPFDTATRRHPVVLAAPAPLRTPGQGSLLEVVTFHNNHDLLTERVASSQPATAPATPVNVAFDQGIVLAGYDVTQAVGALQVTLAWRSGGATAIPYTVFVHLVDRDGKLVSQHDGQPAGGDKATPAWIRGEVVVDDHEIPLPGGAIPAGAHLEVGLYDPVSGARLIAHSATGEVDHLEVALPFR
jgi:uncharacterized membrane protein